MGSTPTDSTMAKVKQHKLGRPRTPSSTPLAVWLDSSACSMTLREVAEKLAISRGALTNLRRGAHKPGRRVASAIEALTDGAVPAASWDAPRKRRKARA